MIAIIHLFWIVPVSVLLGMISVAFIIGATQGNREYDAYQEGYRKGLAKDKVKVDLPSMVISLEEYYDRYLKTDFNLFTTITNGLIYELQGNQLCMLFIEDTDTLSQYFDYEVIEINDEGEYTRPIIKKA